MREPVDVDRIVQNARLGDPDALAELFHRYGRRVHRVAYNLTQSVEDADDILQDVFAGLPEALRSYEGIGRFEQWLNVVATRTALMVMRKQKLRREVPLRERQRNMAGRAEPIVDRVALQRAIARLPAPLRAVFVLKEIEGYSHEEIGVLLGIGTGGSASKLHRARKTLRDLLRSSA